MENPMLWGKAERIVNDTYKKWCIQMDEGRLGLSLAMQVTNALRAEGLLVEELPDAEDGDQPYCPEHGGYICTHLKREDDVS